MIQLSVPVEEAEKFVRQMSTLGYEVDTEQRGRGDVHDYNFKLDGRMHAGYAVTIDYDKRNARIGIRPE
jgi:hypothetical protein